jgi:N-acetyl-anhydromuramyl-L-alanine amidase AmpD
MGKERAYANVKVRKNVRNESSRKGADIKLIVLHDTEGANIKGIRDLQGLANYFDNPEADASSHVGVDAEGQSSRMVADDRKAWHSAYYNAPSLGIEQIGFASQKAWSDAQLRETARWIAWWSRKHGIPIRLGLVSRDGRILKSGIVTHVSLGNLGGNHRDPGVSYPLKAVLVYARHYVRAQVGQDKR